MSMIAIIISGVNIQGNENQQSLDFTHSVLIWR
ncbi:MAG: hypothetical protein H6R25_2517 [Proteobacteria bacterium]|nr:hypothetical protein [Pseudomonadota bacterium]